MIKGTLKPGITLITCDVLIYAPLLRSEQISLPSSDLIAPAITQDNCEKTVAPGSDYEVRVKITDNVEIEVGGASLSNDRQGKLQTAPCAKA